jgi:hypothetical protein
MLYPPNHAKYVSSSMVNDTEEFELQCPRCGCDKITYHNNGENEKSYMNLGSEVHCYECGFEFTVTENCWKLVKIWKEE